MILQKILRRGSDHANFTEDSLAYKQYADYTYACVFDGCSSGIESYFASALFVKAFRDVTNSLEQHLVSPDSSLEAKAKFLIFQMARKIIEVKNVLKLGTFELLSTMVLAVIDNKTQNCFIVAFGDGYFRVDDVETHIQNTKFKDTEEGKGKDKPNYIAYDLDKLVNYNDFDNWFAQQPEKHFFEHATNIAISTDGIGTFSTFKECSESVDPIEFIIKDETWMENVIMLEKKYNVLRNRYCMANKDDIGIIRIKFEEPKVEIVELENTN